MKRRGIIRLTILCLSLWLSYRIYYQFIGSNFHVVSPGKVYRTAQPDAQELDDLIKKYHIRTVVNLRGIVPHEPWYQAEAAVNYQNNISQEDIVFSATRLPPDNELRRLIEVFDRSEYPLLIHCRAGKDRTGVASAVYLLLQPGSTLDQGRNALHFRFGHLPLARTVACDQFLDLYAGWLQHQHQEHSAERFRHWATKEYIPGPARSRLAWLDDPSQRVIHAGKPFTCKIQATNLSQETWTFKPGTFAGHHFHVYLLDAQSNILVQNRRGLRNLHVPPGASTIATIPIPKLSPGHYKIVIDIHDARQAGIPYRTSSFVQLGDRSLSTQFEVVNP